MRKAFVILVVLAGLAVVPIAGAHPPQGPGGLRLLEALANSPGGASPQSLAAETGPDFHG